MEHFIIYMAKAAGLTGVFFLAYHLLLRKETFFVANRRFLLAGLLTSVILPLAVYTKTVWVDPVPRQAYRQINLDELMMMHEAINSPAPVSASINWFDVGAGIYMAGALFFLIRFIIEIVSLRRMLAGNAIVKEGRFLLVDSPRVQSPFSFFNYIVYNSAVLQPIELESIICHEKVHSAQRHSLDMVISQLFCVAFWFNPFAWAYRKSISQNLEFIADAEATKRISDKEAYQKTLLKITVQPECIAITNHFYQSLIKKRIVMLNKQKSKKRNSWKYAVILPALAAFMLAFQVKVVAQEKESDDSSTMLNSKFSMAVEVTKDSKDEELQAESKTFKEEFDADVNFQNITRNQKNEITAIKVTVKDKTQSKVYEVAGTEPIHPFTVEVEKGGKSAGNTISFGSPSRNRISGNSMVYHTEVDSTTGTHKIIRADITGNASVVVAPPFPPVPPVPPVPGMPAAPGRMHVMKSFPPAALQIGDEETLVVINGVKQEKKKGAVEIPAGEEVAEVKILTEKEGKKKYGKEGKKGVVEVTTKRTALRHLRGNGRAMLLNNGEEIELEIGDIDLSGLESLGQLGDMGDMFKYFGDLEFHGEVLSGVDMATIQEELSKAHIEIQKAMEEMDSELSDNEMEKIKKELYKAGKEIMEAKKEIMESRKEMMKASKDAEREKAKEYKERTKKTVYRKA